VGLTRGFDQGHPSPFRVLFHESAGERAVMTAQRIEDEPVLSGDPIDTQNSP
jgi:hypothetical protein